MSIIQEALKKADQHIKDHGKAVQPAEPTRSQAVAPAPSEQTSQSSPAARRDPKAVVILLVVLIATALLAASHLFPRKNIPAKSSDGGLASKSEELPALPSAIFQQPKSSAAAGASPAQEQEEKKPAPPEFVLNGIMYLEGNPRAIINDVMVEAGDIVGGARVVKIEKKSVLLQHNGAEISLDLK